MEYIECTHCGKRYTTNEKIRNSQGDFVRCKHCLEKFMLVIHGSEEVEEFEEFEDTGGWDPTLTVPPEGHQATAPKEKVDAPTSEVSEDSAIIEWDPSATMPGADDVEGDDAEEELSDREIEARAQATLQGIKDAKRKKIITYAALAALLGLLGLTLYMALVDSEDNRALQTQVEKPKRVSAQELDKNNPECREAAAKQWLLDYQAMHSKYSATTFVNILKQSEAKTEAVKTFCKNPQLLNHILKAATAKDKPEWFAAEIKANQR